MGFPSQTWPGLLDDLNRLAFPYRWVARGDAFTARRRHTAGRQNVNMVIAADEIGAIRPRQVRLKVIMSCLVPAGIRARTINRSAHAERSIIAFSIAFLRLRKTPALD